MSNFIFHLMQFWKALRKEKLKPDISKKSGTRFSMHQFQYLFNTVRLPQLNEDKLKHYWKTEKQEMMSETEAKSISTDHAVALRNGNVFVFYPLCRKNKEPKNPSKLAAILNNLKEAADNMKLGTHTYTQKNCKVVI